MASHSERNPIEINRSGGCREDHIEVERSEEREDAEHSEQKTEVSDAIDDERFLAGGGRIFAVVVVADQKIGAEAHTFPAHEHQEEVLGEDEREHREHEQVQIGEVPGVSRVGLVVTHVADRVDMDEETDEGDERRHQGGKRIEPEGQVDREVSRCDPAGELFHDRLRLPPRTEGAA